MWIHHLLNLMLSSTYREHAYIQRAKRLLVPEIERRYREEVLRDDNLLSCNRKRKRSKQLAHLEVVMSLASIHTSQMNAVHCLYDLVSDPEFIASIREEIRSKSK